MDTFKKFDIRVFDAFIEKFAKKYVELRTTFLQGSLDELFKAAESIGTGFELSQIKTIITKNSVFTDSLREQLKQPAVFKDIFRSDLGELLTTYYFEEKTDSTERFIIPLKNISSRERYDMPGRGMDVIGYRISEEGHVNILIGEAKVSQEKNNPPAVVDSADDSIYRTQKEYHDNQAIIAQRLTDYLRKLNPSSDDAVAIMCAIISIDNKNTEKYTITYGCGLVRDYTCVKEQEDYGKMQKRKEDFKPGDIRFAIFSFMNKTIEETITDFYNKVQELKNES